MYDYSKLLGRMREKGVTQKDLAKITHHNLATINQRLSGKSNFTQADMATIANYFNLSADEIQSFFFCRKS